MADLGIFMSIFAFIASLSSENSLPNQASNHHRGARDTVSTEQYVDYYPPPPISENLEVHYPIYLSHMLQICPQKNSADLFVGSKGHDEDNICSDHSTPCLTMDHTFPLAETTDTVTLLDSTTLSTALTSGARYLTLQTDSQDLQNGIISVGEHGSFTVSAEGTLLFKNISLDALDTKINAIIVVEPNGILTMQYCTFPVFQTSLTGAIRSEGTTTLTKTQFEQIEANKPKEFTLAVISNGTSVIDLYEMGETEYLSNVDCALFEQKDGQLIVKNSIFRNIDRNFGYGAVIHSQGLSGQIIVQNVTISNCTSEHRGHAISIHREDGEWNPGDVKLIDVNLLSPIKKGTIYLEGNGDTLLFQADCFTGSLFSATATLEEADGVICDEDTNTDIKTKFAEYPLIYLLFNYTTGPCYVHQNYYDVGECGTITAPCQALGVGMSQVVDGDVILLTNVTLERLEEVSSTITIDGSTDNNQPTFIRVGMDKGWKVLPNGNLTLKMVGCYTDRKKMNELCVVSGGELSLSNVTIVVYQTNECSAILVETGTATVRRLIMKLKDIRATHPDFGLVKVLTGSLTIDDTIVGGIEALPSLELQTNTLIVQSGGELAVAGSTFGTISSRTGQGSVLSSELQTGSVSISDSSFTATPLQSTQNAIHIRLVSSSTGSEPTLRIIRCSITFPSSPHHPSTILVIAHNIAELVRSGSFDGTVGDYSALTPLLVNSLSTQSALSEDKIPLAYIAFEWPQNENQVRMEEWGVDYDSCGLIKLPCLTFQRSLRQINTGKIRSRKIEVIGKTTLSDEISLISNILVVGGVETGTILSLTSTARFHLRTDQSESSLNVESLEMKITSTQTPFQVDSGTLSFRSLAMTIDSSELLLVQTKAGKFSIQNSTFALSSPQTRNSAMFHSSHNWSLNKPLRSLTQDDQAPSCEIVSPLMELSKTTVVLNSSTFSDFQSGVLLLSDCTTTISNTSLYNSQIGFSDFPEISRNIKCLSGKIEISKNGFLLNDKMDVSSLWIESDSSCVVSVDGNQVFATFFQPTIETWSCVITSANDFQMNVTGTNFFPCGMELLATTMAPAEETSNGNVSTVPFSEMKNSTISVVNSTTISISGQANTLPTISDLFGAVQCGTNTDSWCAHIPISVKKESNAKWVAGIVIPAVVMVLILVIVIAVCCYRFRRKRNDGDSYEDDDEQESTGFNGAFM
ncbi:hypothetical protein BLNAU_17368 [Blattamonas nauphoetae]|uniref:Uncharacterized protein n=1 Tax=Blattamonas nauphoetae TaxID=2049346 RepID=A0ABQ9X7M1_9EUKA|nr:hypothetical protein BLNAU_17368 [Blattamonas nauphoetae]